MSYVSLNKLLATAKLATPEQFEEWRKAWQVSASNGSTESLLEFICRESGVSEEIFLQQLAGTLGWPFIDLRKLTVPIEARNKISTKVAFQYNALPVDFQNHTLQVAVSNPFDPGMLNAVQFDARTPVQFALAPRGEIEKALKKYYGVGAETLDELAKDEPIELLVGEDKEITEGDQPLPHRWHFAPDPDAAAIEALPGRDHLAHQGDVGNEHRGETPAAGRPHQRAHQGGGDRHSRFDGADGLRRERVAPFVDPRQNLSQPGQARFFGDGRTGDPRDHHQAARHHAGHGADRLGKIHFAVCVLEHD